MSPKKLYPHPNKSTINQGGLSKLISDRMKLELRRMTVQKTDSLVKSIPDRLHPQPCANLFSHQVTQLSPF